MTALESYCGTFTTVTWSKASKRLEPLPATLKLRVDSLPKKDVNPEENRME